ncbi:hypothetical protein SAMN04515674_104238 [Pseudarcicella hirudinis]|uniref:HTH cro/C1-type domain-containing protein n=1 Tax=Pseudarcicella hirudinis TaxID=1079859 RepID=A0A1I5RTZ3_9BACT|nr:helix-turn-helix transcriptional regulator [Pseudarcicella hirudinis]SFP61850.1 hypothetical protein SAMN04515674_104238 [Pseudarcicella hirudinis]
MKQKFYINGLIVKELMRKKNINSSQMARLLDMTRTNVGNILEREMIKEDLALKILSKLGYTMNDVEVMFVKGEFDKEKKESLSDNYLYDFVEEIKSLTKTIEDLTKTNYQQTQTINALVMAQLGKYSPVLMNPSFILFDN